MLKLAIKIARKKYSYILAIIILAFFISLNFVNATTIKDTGLKATADEGYKSNIPFSDAGETPATMLGSVVGALLSFVGVLFFLLMIYGGFLWMTARGNEQQVEKAKNLIISAVVGLVIIFAAYAITALIGDALKG